ncbi:hypothetical protein ACFLYK_03520 [Candidatus Cloacimonadota bacterium]
MVKSLPFALICLIILAGCASTHTSLKQYAGIDKKIEQQDFQGAVDQIKKCKDDFYSQKDKVLYYLDMGMLSYYAGDHVKSNEYFEKAENYIMDNYTKSVSKAALSMLLNDNALEYAGEDYEDIYLNIFKAFNYLELGSLDDAFVEINRINIKLNKLEDKYRKMAFELSKSKENKTEIAAGSNKFYNDVLGRYLSMLLFRAQGKRDDARIDIEMIDNAWREHPEIYDFSKPDLRDYLKDSRRVKYNFNAFVGKSPVKKARTLYIHTEENLLIIAETEQLPEGETKLEDFHTIAWDDIKKGYHFKFQLPYMEKRDTKVAKVKVFVDDLPGLELFKIEDIGNVALATYKVKEPVIYLKTIIRTVAKGLFAKKRKEEIDKEVKNSILNFAARLATDLAIDATENADLRISRFFPGSILTGEIELDAGMHTVRFEYYSAAGDLLFTDDLGEIPTLRNGLNMHNSFYLK